MLSDTWQSCGLRSGEDVRPVSCCFRNHFQVKFRGHLDPRRRFLLAQGHILYLTVAMRSLHVMLHVAFLGESDVAHLTLEWLLSSVFDHVDLQSALLVEGLVTLSALERPLTCVRSIVSLQLTALGEGFYAGGTTEDSGLLGAG